MKECGIVNGWLTMRSVEPCNQIPEHFIVSRFGCVSKDRRKFYIGWEKTHVTKEIIDGHIVIKVILGKYSNAFDIANVSQGVFDNEVTSDFIKTSSLAEIGYECALTKEAESLGNFINLELVSFEVSEDGKVHEFSLRALKQSNKRDYSPAVRGRA
jgi:hypothetical protein